jgi:hypothetical protein
MTLPALRVAPLDSGPAPTGVRIARIIALDDHLAPLVDFPGNVHGPMPARLAIAATEAMRLSECWAHVDVLLMFVDRDMRQPIVTGIITESLPRACEPELRTPDHLVLEAGQELVLRCGDAKVVLRKDGSLVIAGRDILSRAEQRQRIRGGTVAIN